MKPKIKRSVEESEEEYQDEEVEEEVDEEMEKEFEEEQQKAKLKRPAPVQTKKQVEGPRFRPYFQDQLQGVYDTQTKLLVSRNQEELNALILEKLTSIEEKLGDMNN